jgi:hypothetical protein
LPKQARFFALIRVQKLFGRLGLKPAKGDPVLIQPPD